MSRTPGIDVSSHQGQINWPMVAGAGYRFAFIRATTGNDFTDARFAVNWRDAKNAGLLVSAYHAVRPDQSAESQIDHLFDVLGYGQADLPLVLDVERDDGCSPAEITACVRECLRRVEQTHGRKPIIYTARWFWDPNVLPSPEWAQYDLWVAHYSVSTPAQPAGWSEWKFWQHSETGEVPGIGTATDLDWFAGSHDDLLAYAGSGPPPQPLKVPHDLVQACADGQCILFAGDGVSTLAAFPPRRAFILGLLDRVMEKELVDIDPKKLRAWREEVETGDAELIANNLYESLYRPFETQAAQTSRAAETHQRLEPLYAYLRDMYAGPSTPPPESQVLTEVGFAAAMTTNLDHLLEATFVGADPPFFTPEDTEGLREAFAKREFFTLKLYGSVHEPDTLCIAPAQFKDRVRRNEPFLQFIQTLFLSRKILFVGANFEAINTFLEAIQLDPRVEAPQHYALEPVVGSAWQAQADRLLSRYGIQVLPYGLLEERRSVTFLQELAEQVQTRRRETVEVRKGPARLRSVRLENIGPFEVLELELDTHWNILLGDNGVGKSSILKAVAVGICGKDAQPYAHRLIRSGEKSATVTLETTEGARYVTEILKTDRGAEVRSRTVRPLDAEGWLALGFPPLRSFSWTRPRGSEPQEPIRRATSDDLLPLIADEPDPRMDGLKEWVWYLDYLSSKQQNVESSGDDRYRRLLKEFFEVVDQLTMDVTVRLDHVNPETREITIITDDGKVPIETLSQGTESLIGWTGILLRRLYEMYGDEKNPRDKYAMVLMDELDAHMHPAWQRTLVHNLSDLFPNVQFIATTHSPLAIGGMDVRQVVRLVRDEEGHVVRREVDPDMTMGRTDQVLTGSLFGLETTLDRQTQDKIGRYRELVGMGKRDPDEEREFQDLRKTLEFRIPAPQEMLAERRAQELLQALLLEQVGADYPEVQQQLLEKAERLLTAVQAQGGRQR